METTPGFDDLRAAHAEIDAISAVWPGRILELRGPDTTTENVIAALRTHPIAHFACHALMSHTDPFSARLVLTEDDESPLTLWRLIDAGAAETGELAYLSACRTARASIALPTEALHIAAAFYAAGFRHVIGSLWEVEDSVGLAACRAIYTRLAGGEHAGTLDAARAVNSWARAQRRDDPRTMTRYATITHTGI
jgi:CHAT domain-containing protein